MGSVIITALCPRLSDCHLYRPALPADLFVAARQPRLPAPLFEELDGDLPPRARGGGGAGIAGGRGRRCVGRRRRRRRVELAGEGGGALLNHGLELGVVDVGEGQVEDVAGARGQRGEEAGEEDCVEDGLDHVADGAGVGKDVEDEFGGVLVVHGVW